MEQSAVVTGIILYAAPIGEYDKRVVILTKERGKITAFAKGARRQNSSLIAAANPFVFGEFELYVGRNSYTLMKATIQNYFLELVNSFEGAYYGFYFMEFADYYSRENNDELMLLKLLYQSLRALTKETIQNELVRCIFELKVIMVNGEYPEVFQCQCCGKEEKLSYFSAKLGGMVCSSCVKAENMAIEISDSTLYTMQYIITSPIEKLFTFKVSPQVLGELRAVMKRYIRMYIDKEFKSLPILDSIVTS
ncbi:DNA repair protein RecO [Konateibacter massiliensis]|uniref:DNA repair protein RecO n=1 Tax=Konateibacter massiliensis TaxID=2002841 RepID=UPI000C148664|nr:DNA repair protein RecO [Konateibacter massiliensis]